MSVDIVRRLRQILGKFMADIGIVSWGTTVKKAQGQYRVLFVDDNGRIYIASIAGAVDISDRWSRELGQIDLQRVLGSPLSVANPVFSAIVSGGAVIDPRNVRLLTSSDVVNVSDREDRALGIINDIDKIVRDEKIDLIKTGVIAMPREGKRFRLKGFQYSQSVSNITAGLKFSLGGDLLFPLLDKGEVDLNLAGENIDGGIDEPLMGYLSGTGNMKGTVSLEEIVESRPLTGIYVLAGTPSRIVHIDPTTFTRVEAKTFLYSEVNVRGMVSDGLYLYLAHWAPPGLVSKIILDPLSESYEQVPFVSGNYASCIAISGDFLYIGLETSPGRIVKVDLRTFLEVGVLELASGEDIVSSLLVYNGYLYAGLWTNPGKVVKIDLSTFSRVSVLDITGPSVPALEISGGYLYATSFSPVYCNKIDLSTFTVVDTLYIGAYEVPYGATAVSGSYLYIAYFHPINFDGWVVKIDLATFSIVGTLAISGRQGNMAISGNYLYVAIYTSPGMLDKIDLTTFTLVDTLTFTEELTLWVTVSGAFIYVYVEAPATLKKIDLSTFTVDSSLSLLVREVSNALPIKDPYAYLPLGSPNLIKFHIPNFKRVATLTLASGETGNLTAQIHKTNLYIVSCTSPGKVIKIDLLTFERVASMTLNVDEDYPVASVVVGNYLYLGLNTSPAKIVKIDLTTFSKVATLTLDPDEEYTFSMVHVDGYLYVGLYTSPGKIAKIDLTTFTKTATLTLDTGEDWLYSLVETGGYLYAGLDLAPGVIVKVDLSLFTRVQALTLDTDEDYVECLITDGTHLYAGLYTAPAKIVRIPISTFTKLDTLTLEAGENYIGYSQQMNYQA